MAETAGILVYGASGHGSVLIDILEKNNVPIAGVLDDALEAGSSFCGYPVLGGGNVLENQEMFQKYGLTENQKFVVGIGENYTRERVVKRIRQALPESVFPACVHPSASIARDVQLGEGTVVMAGAVINTAAQIGTFCVLNSGSILEHDCFLGNFAMLNPATAVGGNTSIGAYSMLGIGTNVIHGVTIGENCLIAAGATVVKNIPADSLCMGTPARIIRTRWKGERVL